MSTHAPGASPDAPSIVPASADAPSDGPMTAAQEWRRGWALVLAASAGLTFNSVLLYSQGLFIAPLSREFGWDRTTLSAGITIASMVMFPLSPVVGAALDKWGSRRIAIVGMILAMGAISAFGLANGSRTQWLALWTLYALVGLGIKATVWTAAVSGSFSAARGLAIGFVVSGVAIAQIFVPPSAHFLIENFGWRSAYPLLALLWGGPVLLLVLFFLFDAHDRRRKTAKSSQAPTGSVTAHLPGLTVGQAMRSGSLWKIAISTVLVHLFGIAAVFHQVPILTEAGVAPGTAAWLAALVGVAGLVGKLVTGWLMDRANATRIGGITIALASISFLLLLEPFRAPALIVVSMIVIGYSGGAKLQIGAYLTTRYGGMRNFGKIYGVMSSLIALGSGFGPLMAGFMYDLSGGYGSFLILGIPGFLVAGLLIYRLGAYPTFEATDCDEAAETFR